MFLSIKTSEGQVVRTKKKFNFKFSKSKMEVRGNMATFPYGYRFGSFRNHGKFYQDTVRSH